MVDLDAGRLSKKVLIQLGTDVPDDSGDTVTEWATVCSRWCEIKPVQATKSGVGVHQGTTFQGDQAQMHLRYVVTMRFWAPLTVKHRLVRTGRVLTIDSFRDLEEAHVVHELVCTDSPDVIGSGAQSVDFRPDFRNSWNARLAGAL